MKKYEYKFVRLKRGWFGAFRKSNDGYQQVVRAHAAEGWRLVQVFAPGISSHGAARHFEVILEREST